MHTIFLVGTDNTFSPYLIVFVNTYGKIFKCIIHHVLQLPANNIYINATTLTIISVIASLLVLLFNREHFSRPIVLYYVSS